MGLSLIGLMIIAVMINFANTNVIINELNESSSLAMKQTQSLMMKQVIDHLDLKDTNLFSKISYENYYKKCFEENVIDSSIYEIYVEADANKGIIFVEIDVPSYRLIPTKKLLHLIDVKGDGLDDIDSLYYDEKKITGSYALSKPDPIFTVHTIESWPAIPDGIVHTFTKMTIDIYAAEGSSTSKIGGPLIEMRCTDEKGKKTTIASAEGGNKQHSKISYSQPCNCTLLELVLARAIKSDDYSYKMTTLNTTRTSLVKEETITKVRKEGFLLSNVVDVEMRYLDDINKLSTKSIWLQDNNYQNTLENYLEKLK